MPPTLYFASSTHMSAALSPDRMRCAFGISTTRDGDALVGPPEGAALRNRAETSFSYRKAMIDWRSPMAARWRISSAAAPNAIPETPSTALPTLLATPGHQFEPDT